MRKIALVLMVIWMSSLVLGLGVGPVKKSLQYSSGQVQTVELKIINNEHKDMKIAIYAKGELESAIELEEQIVLVSADEEFRTVSYDISMTPGLKPGKRTANVYLLELPDEFEKTDETLVTATTAVVSQLEVQVPYPGKYAEGKLAVDSSSSPVMFNMQIYNFGSETIANASVTVGIFGPTYEKIAEVKGNTVSLAPQKEGRLAAEWMPDVNPGSYLAIATIDYDGQKIRLEQQFSVSNKVISIKDVSVRDFDIGEIAVFDIMVESLWSDELKGVYGELEISRKGVSLTQFKTASVDIAPEGTATLNGYWDTRGIEEGGYEVGVTVHYAGKSVTKTSDILVTMGGTHIYTPTAKAAGKQGILSKETLLTALVVVLILIVIVLIVLNLRGLRRPPPPRTT